MDLFQAWSQVSPLSLGKLGFCSVYTVHELLKSLLNPGEEE